MRESQEAGADLESSIHQDFYTHSCVIFSILFVRFFIQLEKKNRDKSQEDTRHCRLVLGIGAISMARSKFNDVWNQSKHIKTRIKVMTKCQELLVHTLKTTGRNQAAQIQNFRLFRQIFLFII